MAQHIAHTCTSMGFVCYLEQLLIVSKHTFMLVPIVYLHPIDPEQPLIELQKIPAIASLIEKGFIITKKHVHVKAATAKKPTTPDLLEIHMQMPTPMDKMADDSREKIALMMSVISQALGDIVGGFKESYEELKALGEIGSNYTMGEYFLSRVESFLEIIISPEPQPTGRTISDFDMEGWEERFSATPPEPPTEEQEDTAPQVGAEPPKGKKGRKRARRNAMRGNTKNNQE